MTAQLHVLVGAGGVGKTTLAAGYALALAARGRRVGLLGIDPSRRLEGALGLTLSDLEAAVPEAGLLRAAIVEPHQALERWVAERQTDRAATARLAANPLYIALGDRLATAIDVLAAARLAEWAERDPALDDLVVDTAPGVAAVSFVRAPRQLEALVTGRLVRWLRQAARAGAAPGAARASMRWVGGRVLDGLASIAGARMVSDLAELFALVGPPLEQLLERVEHARGWLAARDTELLLVTSPRDTAAAGARTLRAALSEESLAPCAIVVNRTWPAALAEELAAAAIPDGARPLVDHARAQLAAQRDVLAAVNGWAPQVIALPSRAELGAPRRPALAALGAALADALADARAARADAA